MLLAQLLVRALTFALSLCLRLVVAQRHRLEEALQAFGNEAGGARTFHFRCSLENLLPRSVTLSGGALGLDGSVAVQIGGRNHRSRLLVHRYERINPDVKLVAGSAATALALAKLPLREVVARVELLEGDGGLWFAAALVHTHGVAEHGINLLQRRPTW